TGQAVRLESPAAPPWQVPHEARHEVVRNVPGGDVAVEPGVEAVGDREVGDRPRENAGVEHRRGGVAELRPRVADEGREAVRETLLELHLERVVARVSDIVAI